jgi:hypothetical protein
MLRDLVGSMAVLWAVALVVVCGLTELGQPVLGVFLGAALVVVVSNRQRLLGLFR